MSAKRRRILRIFSGTVFTNEKAKQWGIQSFDKCPHDQEIDTQKHRIWGCKGTPDNIIHQVWEKFAFNTSGWPLNERAVCSIDKPKRDELPESYKYYIDDKECDPFKFYEEDGDIFTDGSAYDMDLPTSVAGASVCQKVKLTGNGKVSDGPFQDTYHNQPP